MATTKGKLLTHQERELCEKIAELNIVLVSRRARALLMLDDGHTQAKSAELSSLTVGQLRYLLILFKKRGTDLFPEEVRTTLSSPPETTEDNSAEAVIKKEKKKKKKKGKKAAAKKKKGKKKKAAKEKSRKKKKKKGKKEKK
ncbi:MAG: hypothetical protein JRC87_06115 [Deltaproteobacteria bacterium]|nr:hypothetical protein [Deltaproteobacteria bacterium]MBW2659156.1 hypothetical protein [Deltaproteobacteria bacterium]